MRDLGSRAFSVWVRVPSGAPNPYNPNLFPIGDGFGLLVFLSRYESTHFRNGAERKPTSKPGGLEKGCPAPSAQGQPGYADTPSAAEQTLSLAFYSFSFETIKDTAD